MSLRTHGWDGEIEQEGLWREKNGGLRRTEGGDGWKAGDKLSFRQRSKMCAGRKTHFVVRRQWTSKLTGKFEGGREGGEVEINGVDKSGGEGRVGGLVGGEK